MTTLLQIHEQHFNARSGTFDKSGPTALVISQMLRLFPKALGFEIDSRSIQMNGKHELTIEFPRLRHVWWPKANTAEAISAEFDEICTLFNTELTK